ncbi:phage minor head protein [Rossellomorea sp. BNER]|uniref:phage minor head protein n=1 Tax=Rossellomorea sp. BNER TaxID=2962031 RepID=UPI003AF1F672|nr:phage head morphogenesis protein [Rossellomorea sp. BNER]
MTRNQNEIDKFLDDKITNAEREIDKLFASRLKELLLQLSNMYHKYTSGKDLSHTDLNKYNRFKKEMALMAEAIDQDYRLLLKEIQALMEAQYIENYLRSAYLYEFEAQETMGFGVPSLNVVRKAIENPIELLKLSKLLEGQRNEIVRKISTDIAQGLLAGESYSDISFRIEKSVMFSAKKARRVARTEGHRTQVQGRLDSAKKASKHVEFKKMWDGTLDGRTRTAHRKLDGTIVDFDGIFVSIAGGKGIAPGLMFNASDDCNCRCSVLFLVNGKKPEMRRSRNEEDPAYQKKLANRIEKYMNEGLTHTQAEKKAKREIKPPSLVIPYQSYEQWYKKIA